MVVNEILKLHIAMSMINVQSAVLTLTEGDSYIYTWLGNNEFQFGRVGDSPTNYIADAIIAELRGEN